MTEPPNVSGLAALAMCYRLLLALNDRNVMPESAIVGVLKDAAQSLTDAPTGDRPPSEFRAAAALLHHIIEGRIRSAVPEKRRPSGRPHDPNQ